MKQRIRRSYSRRPLPNSAVMYVLEGLIPYTDANLKLSFRPNIFFNDLENIDRQKKWQKQKQRDARYHKRENLRTAFYRAQKQGLIVIDEQNVPRLTEKGKKRVELYKPRKIRKSGRLMVIFDIPETDRRKRQHLRLLLKELKFAKVQQSVWMSSYDYRDYIRSEIQTLSLEKYVHVYECARLI